MMRGYDAWKAREPDADYEVCAKCGSPLVSERIEGRTYWHCECCDPPLDPDDWRDAA